MRRRLYSNKHHISDTLEDGIWIMTINNGIYHSLRYNGYYDAVFICVIEGNKRFCYNNDLNVYDITPVQWLDNSWALDLPYIEDKNIAIMDADGKGNTDRIISLYPDKDSAAKRCRSHILSYDDRYIHPYLMSAGELDTAIRNMDDMLEVERIASYDNGMSDLMASSLEIWTSTLRSSVSAYMLYNKQYVSIQHISTKCSYFPIYDIKDGIYLYYGDRIPPIIR